MSAKIVIYLLFARQNKIGETPVYGVCSLYFIVAIRLVQFLFFELRSEQNVALKSIQIIVEQKFEGLNRTSFVHVGPCRKFSS